MKNKIILIIVIIILMMIGFIIGAYYTLNNLKIDLIDNGIDDGVSLIRIESYNNYFNYVIEDTEIKKQNIESIMKKIEVDGVNEGYDGQVILKLDNNYYEYVYKIDNSEYLGIFE